MDLLEGSDIQFRRDPRSDVALALNHHIAIIFLSAADIASSVGKGAVDLGITGQDQLGEYEATQTSTDGSDVESVLDLEFGSCKLQVQVPQQGPYKHPRDLVGHTICTSFVGLTTQYFRRLEQQEKVTTADEQLKTTIHHMEGSVESACLLRMADGIVDLVGKHPIAGARKG